MNTITSRILFPFFKQARHGFLTAKWWFRLIVVVYLVTLVLVPVYLWYKYVGSASFWCYHPPGQNVKEIVECVKYYENFYAMLIGFPAILFHYLVQLIFFQIIINYVVLGGKTD